MVPLDYSELLYAKCLKCEKQLKKLLIVGVAVLLTYGGYKYGRYTMLKEALAALQQLDKASSGAENQSFRHREVENEPGVYPWKETHNAS